MSQFSSLANLLQIVISVRNDNNVGAELERPIALMKRMANAEIARLKSLGALSEALRVNATLEKALAHEVADETRRTIELTVTQTKHNQILRERQQNARNVALATAQAAAQQGNYTLALNHLNTALRLSNIANGEHAIVMGRIARLRQQEVGTTERAARGAASQAIAESRLAAAQGDHAKAQQILNTLIQAGTLTLQQQTRATTELERAQTRAANSARRTATARVQGLRAFASLATTRGDFDEARAFLNQAQSVPGLSAVQRIKLAEDQLRLENRQQAAIERTARSLASRAIEESRALRVSGEHARALEVLNTALRNASITDVQRGRIIAESRRQQEAYTEALRRGRLELAAELRQRLVLQAGIAARGGDFGTAEGLLARAARSSSATENERLAIQARQQQVAQARLRSIFDESIAQARLAQTTGHTRREVELLRELNQRDNLTTRQRIQVTNQLTAAEQRLAEQSLINRTLSRTAGIFNAGIAAFNVFTRALAASVLIGFTIRTVFRGFDRLFIDPLQNIASEAIKTTDEFRRMEAAITGITGSLQGAKELTRDVRLAAIGLPITTLEALAGIRGLAFTPATAQVIQQPQGRESGLHDILRVLTGLATIDPEQGIRGAQFALREALAGEFRSLRFRFEVSPQTIAQSIGKNIEQLKADPSLVIPALRKFVDSFVGQEAIDAFNNLLSVQANLFKGALQEFFHLIGDRGIYDRILNFIKSANEGFRRALTSGPGGGPTPGLRGAAVSINQSLEGLLDTLVGSLESLIKSVTGVSVRFNDLGSGDIEKFAKSMAGVLDVLRKFVAGMVVFTDRVIQVASDLGREVGLDFKPFPTSLDQGRKDLSAAIAKRDALAAATAAQGQKQVFPREAEDAGAFHILGGLNPSAALNAFRGFRELARLKSELKDAESNVEDLQTWVTVMGGALDEAADAADPKDIFRRGNELVKQLDQTGRIFTTAVEALPNPTEGQSLLGQFSRAGAALREVGGGAVARLARLTEQRTGPAGFPGPTGLATQRNLALASGAGVEAFNLGTKIGQLDVEIEALKKTGAVSMTSIIDGLRGEVTKVRGLLIDEFSKLLDVPALDADRQAQFVAALQTAAQLAGQKPEAERTNAEKRLIQLTDKLAAFQLAIDNRVNATVDATEKFVNEFVQKLPGDLKSQAPATVITEIAPLFQSLDALVGARGGLLGGLNPQQIAAAKAQFDKLQQTLPEGLRGGSQNLVELADAMSALDQAFSGKVKVFKPDDKTIDALVDLAGSLPAATERFALRAPELLETVHSTLEALAKALNASLAETKTDAARREILARIARLREAERSLGSIQIGRALEFTPGQQFTLGLQTPSGEVAPRSPVARLQAQIRQNKIQDLVSKSSSLDFVDIETSAKATQDFIANLTGLRDALAAAGVTGNDAFAILKNDVADIDATLRGQFEDLGPESQEDFQGIIDAFDAFSVDFLASVDDMARKAKEIFTQMGQSIDSSIQSALGDAAVDAINTGGQNIIDIMRNLLLAVQRAVVDMIIQISIAKAFGSTAPTAGFFGGLFAGGGAAAAPAAVGAGGGFIDAGTSLGAAGTAFAAHGHVLDSGLFTFAHGGIVTRPHLFPMAHGNVGLMGEAGPEAIMPSPRTGGGYSVHTTGGGTLPLGRDGQGRLAVRTFASGGILEPGSMRSFTRPIAIPSRGTRSGGGTVVINNHFPPGTDSHSFRQSMHQTVSEASRRLQKATRHDGLN